MKLGSPEKAVLSPPTGHKKPFSHLPRVLWPRVLRLVHTKPFSHLPRVYRHLFRVISSATAFHNLIRNQKSPERGPPRTPPESLTSLSDPVKQVCEAASRTPCLPLSDLQQRFKLSDLPQRFQHALGCLLWRAPPSTGGVGGFKSLYPSLESGCSPRIFLFSWPAG